MRIDYTAVMSVPAVIEKNINDSKLLDPPERYRVRQTRTDSKLKNTTLYTINNTKICTLRIAILKEQFVVYET